MKPASDAFSAIRKELLKLIYFLAHKFKTHTPGCEFEDLCQSGEMKLLALFQSHHHALPKEEFLALARTAIRHAMLDELRTHQARLGTSEVVVLVDLDDASATVGESGFEALFVGHLVEYLGHFVSSDARILLQNLVNPSQEVLDADLAQTLRREHIKRQGVRVAGSKKLTHTLVGSVLGFSPSKTKSLIRELQVAYCHHVVPLRGAPCPRLYPSLMLS